MTDWLDHATPEERRELDRLARHLATHKAATARLQAEHRRIYYRCRKRAARAPGG